jgi:hypothetical protein
MMALGTLHNGKWLTYGYNYFNNGVVAAISLQTGEVLAVEILTKHCQMCEQ